MTAPKQQRRRHKAFVVTTDDYWVAFRALCLVRGATIEHALGALVERIVDLPQPMDAQKVIGAATAALKTPEKASGPPAAAKRRSAAKRRPTGRSSS